MVPEYQIGAIACFLFAVFNLSCELASSLQGQLILVLVRLQNGMFYDDKIISINTVVMFKAHVSCHHEDDKIIVFERASLLWVFNFHSTKSFPDYRIGASIAGKYPS